ncbi:sodium:proton antiporter [Natronospora cellulosivora (SeqCode)]
MLYHIVFLLLFMLGLHTVLIKKSLIKIVIGLNLMEAAVFFWVIAVNYRGGIIPILTVSNEIKDVVNPLPQALILTGIVIGASTTAFLLTLVIEINKYAKIIDLDLLKGLRD